MTTRKSFPWSIAFFTVLSIVGCAFIFDVKSHDGFQNSISGTFLKESGALETGQQVCERALGYAARGYKWSEANLPQYYDKGLFYVRPYLDVAYDTTLLTKNIGTKVFHKVVTFICEKGTVLEKVIDGYFPGFVEDAETSASATWKKVSTVSVEYFNIGCDYLKTRVFTGQLSPENLQKVTLDVLNKTQDYASKYYSWFYEKIDTYSKVQ